MVHKGNGSPYVDKTKKKDKPKKRKIEELKEDLCVIEYIPKGKNNADNRWICEICKAEQKEEERKNGKRVQVRINKNLGKGRIDSKDMEEASEKKRACQTRFRCKTCEVPVCILECYDRHRLKSFKNIKMTYDLWVF